MARPNKVVDIKEAVALVKDGDRVWTGGWTVVRKPMALVYELIRQNKKDLHLVANPGGPEIDLLVGAGCASMTETNYIGHEVFGHPYAWRRKLENKNGGDSFNHDDWTVQTGALRLVAGAMGVPFIPTMSLKGSDIINPELDSVKHLRGVDPRLPKQKVMFVKDPFWEGEEVALIPALRPDVALIHAQEAAEDGTVRIRGGAFLDYYAAMASKTVIVSVERIVPRETLTSMAEANTIPGLLVDAVVEIPYGAHPTAVCGCYDNDPWWFQEYLAASKSEEALNHWLHKWVYYVEDFQDYLNRVGLNRLLAIQANPVIGYNPHIKRRLDKLEEVD